MIEVHDGFDPSLLIRRYSHFTGRLLLESGPVDVNLAKQEGTIAMTFNNVVNAEYYNCVEATFTARMSIESLDIVTIYLDDGTGLYKPVFKGRAQLTGNRDAPIHEYAEHRIVGLLEDLETESNNVERPGGQSLEALARYYAALIPSGSPITWNNSSITAPGTEPSKYAAGYKSILEVLTDLATRAGSDCKLGINGRGVLYWKIPDTTTKTYDTTAAEWNVQYPSLSVQDYCDKVRWVISSGNVQKLAWNNTLPLDTPDLLTHLSESEDSFEGYSKTKVMDVPNDVLALEPIPISTVTVVTGSLFKSFLGDVEDNVPWNNRIIDLNPATYALYQGEQLLGTYPESMLSLRCTFAAAIAAKEIVAVRINYRLQNGNDNDVEFSRFTSTLYFQKQGGGPFFLTTLRDGSDFGEVDDEFFVVGDRNRGVVAGNAAANDLMESVQLTLSWRGTTSNNPSYANAYIAVESLVAYRINKAVLDKLAEKEYKLTSEDSFIVQKEDSFLEFSPRVTLQRGTSSTLSNLTAEQYRYVISGEGDEDENVTSNGTEITFGYFATYGYAGMSAKAARKRDQQAQQKAVQKALSYNR